MERIEHKVGEIFEFEEEKIITVEVEESLCYINVCSCLSAIAAEINA